MPYDYVLLLQAVVAKAGAVPALVKRLIRTAPHEDDHNLFCLERICAALASLMLYPGNRERLHGTVMYGSDTIRMFCSKLWWFVFIMVDGGFMYST